MHTHVLQLDTYNLLRLSGRLVTWRFIQQSVHVFQFILESNFIQWLDVCCSNSYRHVRLRYYRLAEKPWLKVLFADLL
jgi:hypothetical protein